jgi:hypothetical protein
MAVGDPQIGRLVGVHELSNPDDRKNRFNWMDRGKVERSVTSVHQSLGYNGLRARSNRSPHTLVLMCAWPAIVDRARQRAGEMRDGDKTRERAEGTGRVHQCFGSYFDDQGGSCALGAVYEGVYHLPRAHGKLIPDHLERLFRCLDEVTKACPQGCKKRLPLASMIVHLNDDHRMTREQIAEWLTQESTG